MVDEKLKMIKNNFNYHNEIMKNLTEGYKEGFNAEEKFLKNNIIVGSKVLEVGCGDGRSLVCIKDIAKEIFGIDHNEKAVELAQKRFYKNKNVKIIEADALKLPFNNNYFDYVLCMTTPANFGDNKYKIYSEIKRVLRERGFFILSVFNEFAFQDRIKIYKKLNLQFRESSKKGKVIFDFEDKDNISEQFSQEDITNILNKSGFKICEIKKGGIFYLIKAGKK
jgi:ubiquinone/menaquinone biosynthesis C-methylase UbiE